MSASPNKRSAGNCGKCAIAGCRHVRVATLMLPERSRLLKNSHHASGRDRARGGHRPRRRRSLVRRRARVGQKNKIIRRWAKRGTRPSAPQDQRTASTYIFGAICPATGATAGLDLPWCNTEGDGSAPGRDRRSDHAGQALRALGRSGRLARLGPARGSGQHHDRPAAGQVPGVEPGRERLVDPARQLAVEPDLPLIQRHRRPLLRRLDPSRRPTLAGHEPRITKLGARSPAVRFGMSIPTMTDYRFSKSEQAL